MSQNNGKVNGNGASNGSGNSSGNGSSHEPGETEEPQGLVFPCDFPLKMFGKNTLHFIAAVDKTVEEHVPREDWSSTKTTPSRNDKYVSYTIVIIARNREQLDKVCAAVTNCPEVIMAL